MCHARVDKAAATSSMQTPNGFRAVSPEAPVTPANSSETFPQHSTSAPSPSYISTEACLASQPEPAAQAAEADHDESTSPTSTGSPSHGRVPSADRSADGSLPSLDRRAESDPGAAAATAGSASGSLSESNDEAGPNPKAEVEEVLRMALAWLRRADPYGFPAAGGNSEQGAAGRPPAGHKVGYLLSGDWAVLRTNPCSVLCKLLGRPPAGWQTTSSRSGRKANACRTLLYDSVTNAIIHCGLLIKDVVMHCHGIATWIQPLWHSIM